ncbi:glycoside hydrolase family 88 protein [Pedobacter arcticus]|uniref:glycoside hydrolase family 88 protein n=1 Tax=Pedobacter arcticus TaxID=752140 RepID=UPI0002F95260|nr:glycoside hydrolase family 88 protein [Pedobacter arcticus]
MKKITSLLIGCVLIILGISTHLKAQQNLNWLKNAKVTIVQQLKKAGDTYTPGLNPRSVYPTGKVRLTNNNDWTTGFFPGSLWYGYEMSGDNKLKADARKFTLALDSVQYVTDNHDLGFMLYCSYGNGYRLTNDKIYLPPLKNGAQNLANRFNPTVGAIRSWDFGKWQYPVIIDNMMNLEFLFWSADKFKKPEFAKVAEQHAITTMKNHFREDISSYHVIDYDTLSGRAISKGTYQGLTDESAWARGQAWGLYGYVMSYKETKNKIFLDFAVQIASFIMNHPNTDVDKIPYWDYNVHNNGERAAKDASAGAVIASALLDLSKEVKDGQKYFDYAEFMLKSLSSPEYLAAPNTNNYFLLKHSVGALLYNSEVNTPLNYADYYYLEALLRYANLKNIDLKTIN